MGRKKQDPLERFMSHVRKRTDGCWRWTGTVYKGRLTGQFNYDMVSWSARRWAWVHIANEMISSREVLLVTCGNSWCVNPKHLKRVPNGTQRGQKAKKV